MNIDTWAVVFATLLGPVLAVQAQRIVAEYGERKRRQLQVFRSLMNTRVGTLTVEHVDAINTVPLEFHRDRDVMQKWRIYLDHLNKPTTQEGWGQRRLDYYTDLLGAMAKRLKYGFDSLQIKNEIYAPKGHLDLETDQQVIRSGVVALMKGEKALPMEVRSIAQDEDAAARLKKLQEELLKWLRGETIPRVKIDEGRDRPRGAFTP